MILAASDLAAEDCRRAAAGELGLLSVGRLSLGFTGSTTYVLLPRAGLAEIRPTGCGRAARTD